MHVRTFKLAKFSGDFTYWPPLNREGTGMGERADVKGRRGEGKEKVEGMTEGRERKDGELGWGDLCHCC